MPHKKPSNVINLRERADWQKYLQEYRDSLEARIPKSDGMHRRDYVERYGRIPRGKSKLWHEPRKPPPSPCHTFTRVHPQHVEFGRETASLWNWSTQFYPGSTHQLEVGGVKIRCSLGCAIGISQVRMGTITEVTKQRFI